MKTSKKIKLLDFQLSKSIWNNLFGIYKSKFYGNGMDFFEHRDYTFWQPIKHIDWKASAKAEKMYTKVFEEERDIRVLFLIDTNNSMSFWVWEKTKKELLEEVFYALSFSVYKNNDSFGVYFYTEKQTHFLPYKRDATNIFLTIEKLQNLQKNNFVSEKRTIDFLEILKKQNTKDTLIFILTDDTDFFSWEKALKTLSQNNQLVVINLFDYFENNLQKVDNFVHLWTDTSFLHINLSDAKKRKKYQDLRRKKLENLSSFLKKQSIDYLHIDTNQDAFKELYLAFK